MEIHAVRNNVSTLPNKNEKFTAKDKEAKTEQAATEPKDEYIPSGSEGKKATYDKPKVDQTTIARLKEESDRAYSHLRKMVEELLARQGKTFHDVELGDEIEVDEATRLEAQALIGEGGDLSPEKVSDRIVEFAKALSGGDLSKFEELKQAIEEGFMQAAHVLGGELPEVSQRTYDLVMEKLEQWKNEGAD